MIEFSVENPGGTGEDQKLAGLRKERREERKGKERRGKKGEKKKRLEGKEGEVREGREGGGEKRRDETRLFLPGLQSGSMQ